MIHMLSVGIDQSVSQYLVANLAELEREIAKRTSEQPASLKLAHQDREELAASEYMANLTRRFRRHRDSLPPFLATLWELQRFHGILARDHPARKL